MAAGASQLALKAPTTQPQAVKPAMPSHAKIYLVSDYSDLSSDAGSSEGEAWRPVRPDVGPVKFLPSCVRIQTLASAAAAAKAAGAGAQQGLREVEGVVAGEQCVECALLPVAEEGAQAAEESAAESESGCESEQESETGSVSECNGGE